MSVRFHTFAHAAAGLGTALALAAAQAGTPQQVLSKEGVDIYYGFQAADTVAAPDAPSAHMAGPAHKRDHHLVVTLVDRQSGRRLEAAKVSATVTPLGLAGQRKTLEAMSYAGTVSYGNYFRLDESLPNRVKLRIHMPGRKEALDADFVYQRPAARP